MKDLRPRDIGELIDDAIATYRANARPILFAAALVVFPAALLAGLGQEFYVRGFFESIVAGSGSTTAPSPGFDVLAGYAATVAGGWLLLLGRAYLDSAILAAYPQMLRGRVSDEKAFLKAGLSRWGWYLLTAYLVQMIVSLAAVASFFALFAGGLAAWALLSLAATVTVLERANTAQAIQRSYALVKRHFWRTLGYLAIVTTLVALFEGALASPLIVRQIVVAAQNPDAVFQQTPLVWKIVEGLVLGAAMTLVAPIMPLALASLYADLRARSEGMDLIVRAREIAARRA
ncbi:MAG: hypothetical protein H5T75_07260 [Coriobacteriia bacterium]|nr:hypothetical protein [Coriobacteriia bacterium]